MNPALWTILITAAVQHAPDILALVLDLFRKDAVGQPITPEDWNTLAAKWTAKSAADYLRASLAH